MQETKKLLILIQDNPVPTALIKIMHQSDLLNEIIVEPLASLTTDLQWSECFAILLLGVCDEDSIKGLEEIPLPVFMRVSVSEYSHLGKTLKNLNVLASIPVYVEYQDQLLVDALLETLQKQTSTTTDKLTYNQDFVMTTLGALGDGVIVSDTNGHVQYINQAARDIVRYYGPIYEMEFERLFQIKLPTSHLTELFLLERVLKKRETFGLHRDTMLKDQEGRMKYISASISPMEITGRGLIGFVVIFRDISRIRESEKRLHLYSETFRQSLESIVITNNKFEILNANLQFFETFKCKREETIGRLFFELPSIEDVLEMAFVQQQLNEYTMFKEMLSIHVGRQDLHFSIMINAVIEESAVYYLITLVDMTKQLNAEKRLSEERENLLTIFEGLPLGVLILDDKRRIIRANIEIEKLFRVKLEDVLLGGLGNVVHCGNLKATHMLCGSVNECHTCNICSLMDRVLKDKKGIKGEDVLVRSKDPSGRVNEYWYRMSIVPFEFEEQPAVMVVLEDVTETKAIANSLIENEMHLRLITDNMIDIVTQTSLEGEILYASPSHLNLMGYAPESLIGKKLFDFIHPDDLQLAIENMKKRIETHGTFVTEHRLRRQDGLYIWLESMGNVLTDRRGKMSLVYVSRDVTIKRQALDDMQLAKEAAEAANKAKSQFLATMSHEIRTPMNGIIGMTNLTLMSELTSDQRENLALVKNSAENLLKIINSILDFSKIEAGKIILETHPFNLRQTVGKVINPLKVEASTKGVALRVEIDTTISPILKGDSNRLMQILNNLIGNAIKFTHRGQISILVKKKNMRHDVSILCFEVKDTGIGIAKENHHKLFESFSQVDGSMTRRYGGTGLGLTITKQLVEIMGGKIEVESELDVGTTFRFELPFHEVAQYIQNDDFPLMVPKPRKKLRVLVVEDDLVNQTLATRLLEKQGHEVFLAVNGHDALDILTQMNFDLVLMDIQMPLMDGVEATKRIRQQLRYRELPIVALTAHAIKGDQEKFLSAGMDAYISKPIQIEEFYRVINDLTNDERSVQDLYDQISQPIQSEEVTSDMHNAYVGELQLNLTKISTAIHEKQYNRVEELAHFIKNLALTVNDSQVKKWAMRLELACRKEAEEAISKGYEDLKAAIKQLQ